MVSAAWITSDPCVSLNTDVWLKPSRVSFFLEVSLDSVKSTLAIARYRAGELAGLGTFVRVVWSASTAVAAAHNSYRLGRDASRVTYA